VIALVTLLLLSIVPIRGLAEERTPALLDPPRLWPGTHRGLSLQAIAGPLWFPVGIGPDEESVRSVHGNLRLGWSFGRGREQREHPPHWSERLELLLEATYSHIYEGPGRVISGPSLLLRYNTRPLFDRVVPYLQGGAGLAYADLSRDRSQGITGQRFNFILQAAAGLRFPIAHHWSLDTELLYFHISNAQLDDDNRGLNSLGGLIGFTRSFDAF
jgi:hypothetical protein